MALIYFSVRKCTSGPFTNQIQRLTVFAGKMEGLKHNYSLFTLDVFTHLRTQTHTTVISDILNIRCTGLIMNDCSCVD